MDFFNTVELAKAVLGLPEDKDFEAYELRDKLDERYENYDGDSLMLFHRIAKDLIKFTPIVKSELTDTLYHAFGKQESDSIFNALAKEEYVSTT